MILEMWRLINLQLEKNNMSIYQLSKLTGIPDTSLHNYKNGSEPSFKNMVKIADALNISLDYFRKGVR